MEKTKYYKNGNPEAYRFFTEIQWKGLCERDKGMWTKYSENEPAAIPQDVIDFTNANDLSKPCCEEVNKCKELEAEVERLKKQIDKISAPGIESALEELEPEQAAEVIAEEAEDQEKDLIKARLKELGVPFRVNTGIVKLRLKLEEAENANNTE